jgi:P-type Cu2+ transporter
MNSMAKHPLPTVLPISDAAWVQTGFSVPGMRCAGCISKLESGLAKADGVAAARVNFTAKRVTITHDREVPLPHLLGAITALGFEAQALGDVAALGDNADSGDLLRALAVAGFAAMNIMLLSVSVWSGAEAGTRDLFHWLSALIALPTVAYSGRPFFRSAWAALQHGRTNMDVPISIGVILASALSLFETIMHGDHAYFDGAVMLLFFLLAGRWLDSVMRDRARDGVAALLKHRAAGAMVMEGKGATRWCDAQSLLPGMMMIVASGERLAADGRIVEGQSQFDLSLMTGESVPVSVQRGDVAHAGTLNLDAPLVIEVSAAGEDTAIADIARMMEEAAQSKSRYVRIADRAARYYAPAVHTLAALSFAGWMLSGAGWHHSLLIAVAVLIITCPCALGLAVPAAQIVAAGALMRAGVLVKDGSALERLAEADIAMVDKTGTLTLGRPVPVDLEAVNAAHKSVMLALARSSRHPLSEALRGALEKEQVTAAILTDLNERPGFGMIAQWNGKPVSLARPEQGMETQMLVTCLSVEGAPVATVHFADPVRPDAAKTIADMERLGISAMILSGDRMEAVAPVARELGLMAQASLSPQDKLDAIARQNASGHKVLMVGDGLNDGPALAAGHVSLAPGSASDAGQNAADAIFLGDSIAPLATAVRVARATQRIVRQNFVLAIGYNIIAVPLAIMGMVTPLIAALAMSGSSVIVVANALRLRNAGRA